MSDLAPTILECFGVAAPDVVNAFTGEIDRVVIELAPKGDADVEARLAAELAHE